MYKVCIFDLDGTLIDSIVDVAYACNFALEYHGFPKNEISRYKYFVGGKLENFIGKALPEGKKTTENIDRVKVTYKKYYAEHSCDRTIIFDGVRELLRKLSDNGIRVCVNSNKAQDLIELILGKMFPDFHFDEVIGYLKDLPPKPHPDGVYKIAGKFGAQLSECVYIGDTKTDIATAQNAGIDCVCVTWGQGAVEELMKCSPACIVSSAEEIGKLVLAKKPRTAAVIAAE